MKISGLRFTRYVVIQMVKNIMNPDLDIGVITTVVVVKHVLHEVRGKMFRLVALGSPEHSPAVYPLLVHRKRVHRLD